MQGVGQPSPRRNEEPVPAVRGADGSSGDAIPDRIIPERGQVPKNLPEPAGPERSHVLDDDRPRRNFIDDAGELGPQARARASEACTLACKAKILAGKAAAQDIDGAEVVGADGADVFMPDCFRPVLFQDLPAEGIALHLPGHRAVPGPLQAEFQAADAGEQTTDHVCSGCLGTRVP